MNLLNKKVLHITLGEGTIISHDENNKCIVRFANNMEKKFLYPVSFKKFLSLVDPEIKCKVTEEIRFAEEKKQQEKKERLEIIEMERKEHLEYTKGKSKNKILQRSNIVFKCNYCDGGSSNTIVGFNGICTDVNIRNNIETKKKVWCSTNSPCKKYLDGKISRKELEERYKNGELICYECKMLEDWKALAGIVQSGKRAGEKMKLNKVQPNSLCVLSTRDPSSYEKERYIFGVFLVDEAYSGDAKDEGYVTTQSKYKISLTPKEAHKMLFWNYHKNGNKKNVALWGSGLHRYFGDDEAVQILKDLVIIKEGTADEALANEFLEHFCKINGLDSKKTCEKSGALVITN